ncbi:hypothetical protein NC651_017198 [Populus alba x Populus x berolinensis]|nr:hypothetical protein NC651_017198 [Populus alba x Populus x berolinensis]
MLEGKYDEQQVKKALLVGLACLHPDTKGRPTVRKVEQILLKPNEPLMKVSESRPTAIFVPLYSAASTARSTAVLGLKVTVPCCSQPLKRWCLIRLLPTMKIVTCRIGFLGVLKTEFYSIFEISYFHLHFVHACSF